MTFFKTLVLPSTFSNKFERFIIYACFMLASAYIAVTQVFTYGMTSSNIIIRFVMVLLTIAFAFFLFLLLNYIAIYVSNKKIGFAIQKEKSRMNFKMFFAFFLIISTCLIIGIIAYYPGGISVDNKDQWTQIQSGIYDDWHPALHTFIIKLISLIVPNYSFVIVVQNFCFAIGMAYLFTTLHAWGFSKKILFPVFIFLSINNTTISIMEHAWKDTAMTIFLVFLATQMINVFLSKGQYLDTPRNAVSIGIVLAFTTIMRHNAFFLTLPLLVILIYLYVKRHKKILIAGAIMLIGVLLIQGPLYTIMDVQKPDNTYRESVGVPMVILGNVYMKNPNALPEETVLFLDEFIPENIWEKHQTGNYNSVKFYSKDDVLNEVPPTDLIKWTYIAIKNDFPNAMDAFQKMTQCVWDMETTYNFYPGVLDTSEYYPLHLEHKESNISIFAKDILDVFKTFTSLPILNSLSYKIGFLALLLIVCGCITLRKHGQKNILFVVPALAYNIGTMLLLCTPYDKRFFHFNLVLTIPICLVMLSTQKKRETIEEPIVLKTTTNNLANKKLN